MEGFSFTARGFVTIIEKIEGEGCWLWMIDSNNSYGFIARIFLPNTPKIMIL